MADVQAHEAMIAIPWRPWEAGSFRLAQERQIPILLSISAVWCHWCHVMDDGTYRDPEVIRRAATEVVPIRVDADRRPDLNNRYNLGGWPTTAFLTPEGDLLSGGTYMPAEELLSVFDETVGYYRDQREDLERKLERRRARRGRMGELRHRLRGEVAPSIVDTVVDALRKSYDPRYGGFGKAPKFPLPDALELALAIGHATGDQGLLGIADTTLTAMAEGGMYDHVAGGFFRYSTTEDWSRPHYEKILDGNARLLSAYLHAAQVLDRPLFRRTARGVQTFAEALMLEQESGAFAGSVCADEEYYKLRADARAERQPPSVDTTLYSDWNAMMISAFLEAAAFFDEPYLGEVALGALEAIWARNWLPGAGLAHYYDGSARVPGLIADQAWLGQALLNAQTYAGQGDYLSRAEEVMRVVQARLLDSDIGGFYDVPYDPAALGRLRERLKLLDENAVAAELAVRLHRLTGRNEYYDMAVGSMEVMAPLYRAYRQHAAAYALTVYHFTFPPLHLIVVGDPAGKQCTRLRLTALSIYDENRLVESVDPVGAPERLRQLDLPATPVPALYARRGDYTSPPIEDPAQVRAAIEAVPA